MNQNEGDNEWDSVNAKSDVYLRDVIKPVLPSQFFSGKAKSGTIAVIPELCLHNRAFRDSKYYYEGKLEFIHYTSINSFLNILNEKAIRLSSFNLFDDPQEFYYGHKELSLSSFSFTEVELKNTLFAMSFCEYDNDNMPDNFDMWRLYGNDGNGVAIVFSFENEPIEWQNYYLSRVYYGEEYLNVFKEMNKRHNEFFKNSNLSFGNTNLKLGQHKVPLAVSILLGCHKNSLYGIENEIRLINYYPIENHANTKELHFSINKNLKTGYYVNLPLSTNASIDDSCFDKTTPNLRIKKLIFGYRHNEVTLNGIRDFIRNAAFEKIQKNVTVEISRLKKHFNK